MLAKEPVVGIPPGFVWRAQQKIARRAKHPEGLRNGLLIIRNVFEEIKHGHRVEMSDLERADSPP